MEPSFDDDAKIKKECLYTGSKYIPTFAGCKVSVNSIQKSTWPTYTIHF